MRRSLIGHTLTIINPEPEDSVLAGTPSVAPSGGPSGGTRRKGGGEGLPAGCRLLGTIAPTGRGPTSLNLLIANHQHERHLLLLGQANLVLHTVGGVIDADANARGTQYSGTSRHGFKVPVGNRDNHHLLWGQPEREGAGVVLNQDADEALKRTIDRAVNGDRTDAL